MHGELINATEHDIPDIILQRASELRADIIVLGYQHHRGPRSPNKSSGGIRNARSCWPDHHTWRKYSYPVHRLHASTVAGR